MPMINPNNYDPNKAPSGGGNRNAPPGEYTALAIGHDFRETRTGKQLVEIRFVVLKDHSDNNARGCTFDLTFWLTDRAMWRLENFAWATGYKEMFDPYMADHLEKVMVSGPVKMTLKKEQVNGYDRYDIEGRFNRASGYELDPTTGACMLSSDDEYVANAAADSFARLMAARLKNRKPTSSGGQQPSSRSNSGADMDVPF